MKLMTVDCRLSQTNSSKIRNLGIICAFLVVVIHCRPNFADGSLGWWVCQILENGVAQIAVPFFFTVTGYMVARGMAMPGGGECVITKRMRTLLVPFAFWNFLFWAFTISIQNLPNIVHGRSLQIWFPTLQQIGVWYTGCPLLTPLWYVRAIFVLTVCSPVIIWFVKRAGVWYLALLFAVYGVVCPFWPLPEVSAFEWFARVGVFPLLGMFYFALGVAIREGVVGEANLPKWVSAASLCAGIVFACVRAVFVWKGIPCAQYLGFACVPFALYGAWGLVSGREWPKWIVTSSFGVYLIHKFILTVFKYIVQPNLNVGVYLGMAFAAFAFSLAVVVIVKRVTPRVATVIFGGR